MFIMCNISRNTLVLAVIMAFLPNIASAEENASNPLASVSNVDLRWQGIFADAGEKYDFFVDGSHMLMPKLKLKYELHYNINNFTGSRQSNFEKLVIKPLYFPYQTKLNDTWAMKVAVGIDWIVDLGDTSKAIGAGSDQVAPFAGIAFSHTPSGLVLIPLVQHFLSYRGSTDINTTSLRLIVIKPFGKGYWVKVDFKAPYEWENDKWPVSAEVQVGYNINKKWAIYAEGLVGIGRDRPYNAGVGVGLRFKY